MRIYSLALLILVCMSSFAAQESNGQNSARNNVRPASQVYRRYCVSCHGIDGKAQTSKGKFSHARDLTDAEWQGEVSDERVFNSIMNGRNVRGNMPNFANKLNEKEVNALVEFVRGLKS
jgi:mono/diheme cytochrome c family protein